MNTFLADYVEPTSYGLYFFALYWMARTTKQIKIRVLAVYYFLASAMMIRAALSSNNLYIYSLLSLLTATSISIFFYYTFTNRLKKSTTVILYLLNVAYFVFSQLTLPTTAFDSGGYALLSISVVLMVFMFMHQILRNITLEPLSLNFDFWFVCAQLVYHVGAFAIFLTFRYLTHRILPTETYSVENRILLVELWGVHNVLLFLSALVIVGSVLWISFRKKSPSS